MAEDVYEYDISEIKNDLTHLWIDNGYIIKRINRVPHLVRFRVDRVVTKDEVLNKILGSMRVGVPSRVAINESLSFYGLTPVGSVPSRLPSFLRGRGGIKGTVLAMFDYDRYSIMQRLIRDNQGLTRFAMARMLQARYAPLKLRSWRETYALLDLLIYLGFLRLENRGLYFEAAKIAVGKVIEKLRIINIEYDIYVIGEYFNKRRKRLMKVMIRVRKVIALGEKPPKGMTWDNVFGAIRAMLVSDGFLEEVMEKFDEEIGWPSGINNFITWFMPRAEVTITKTEFLRDVKSA